METRRDSGPSKSFEMVHLLVESDPAVDRIFRNLIAPIIEIVSRDLLRLLVHSL